MTRSRLRHLVFVLIAAALITLGFAQKADLDRAERFLEHGDFPQARKIFLAILEKDQGNINALQGAAISSINMGDAFNAANIFERAVELRPAPELLYNTGRVFMQLGNIDKSIHYLRRCTSISSGVQRECHIKLAQLFRDRGDNQEVQIQLQHAIALDPNKPDAYSYLADTYNNIKQFGLAIEMYDKAIKMSPNNPMLWNSKGDAFNNMKQSFHAMKCYEQARKLAGNKRSPPLIEAIIGYYFSAMDISLWKNYEKTNRIILREIAKYAQESTTSDILDNPPPLSAYRLLFLDVDPKDSISIASAWSRKLVQQELSLVNGPLDENTLIKKQSTDADNVSSTAIPMDPVVPMDPIVPVVPMDPTVPIARIGYLSRRFEDYPGTQMMMPLFGRHNRTRVHVSAVAAGADDGSVFRSEIRKDSDTFDDVATLATTEAVQIIHERKLDVLIDYGTPMLMLH